jgi:hypothetical protein
VSEGFLESLDERVSRLVAPLRLACERPLEDGFR